MVKVVFKRRNNIIESFELKGHADYADKGQDIICSAISAISYTAVGYFENKYNPKKEKKKTTYTESSGYMKFDRPLDREGSLLEGNAVLEAMEIGLRQIEDSYGKKFIQVRVWEVEE